MYRVLIATTDGNLAKCLDDELSSNYTAYTCHRGDDVLELLASIQPEILVIDLGLPYMDALTILRVSSYKPTVILGLTTYWDSSLLEVAEAAGIDSLVMLPTPIDVILECIQTPVIEKLHAKSPSSDM